MILGDQNINFYHNACQERIVRNNINLFILQKNAILTDSSAIKRETVDYFLTVDTSKLLSIQ